LFKILIVGLNFKPELTGVGKYTGELAAYLSAQGFEVHVVTTPPYYPYWQIQGRYCGWHYKKEVWQGVEVIRCPLWVPRRPTGFTRLVHLITFAFSSLPALIVQLCWRPAVVLSVAPSMISAPFVLAFAWLCQAETWLHVQDFELDAAVKLKLLPGINFFYSIARRLERFILSHFAHVSTISENMRLLCIEKGVNPQQVFLLPNWADTKKIHPLMEVSPLRAELSIPSQAFVALYHGNMGRKQGLEFLIEAARLLKSRREILFVLCGDGPVKKELAEQAALLSNVYIIDLQPEEKLNELVNLADVHLLPQLANAADLVMPSKLSTMLASGKPVIASARPGTQISQILNAVGVLVQPENSAALAESIIDLYENPLERLRLGELSRSYACQVLDKEVVLSHFRVSFSSINKNQALNTFHSRKHVKPI
jgi:colanic acid biosynthesis glycosyl transferase WcaI